MQEKAQVECWHFLVSGIVQGVGYRQSVKNFVNDEELEFRGFVRNLADGSVELKVVGSKDDLLLLHEFCLQGPSRSRVDKVEIEVVEIDPHLSSFEIQR